MATGPDSVQSDEITRLRDENQRLRIRLAELEAGSNGPSRTLHGLQEMVVVTDRNLVIKYLNSAMEQLLRANRSAFIGRPLGELSGEGLQPGFLEPIARVAATAGSNVSQAVARNARTGGLRYLNVIATAGPGGEIQIVLEDQSRLKTLENTFNRYISANVVAEVLRGNVDPHKARKYELSVLFADLRGFTAASAEMDPATVKAMVDEFLGMAVDVIMGEDATVDKLVGDEIMALFGAPIPYPDHAVRAVNAALKIQLRHVYLSQSWEHRGLPVLPVGIGINSGLMVVGNIGCEKRMDYTVLGHNVNLAARLCSAAKGGEILVSPYTFELAKSALMANPLATFCPIKFRRGETIQAKGIREPVDTIAVIQAGAPHHTTGSVAPYQPVGTAGPAFAPVPAATTPVPGAHTPPPGMATGSGPAPAATDTRPPATIPPTPAPFPGATPQPMPAEPPANPFPGAGAGPPDDGV